MAAYVVVEVPPGEERTYFTGSSSEDMEYAKSFWKSIQLNPEIESRLVSSDIRQRVPPSHQKAREPTRFKYREEDPVPLKQYFMKVQVQESMDALAKRMKSQDKRSEDLERLKKRKSTRFMVQQAAHQPAFDSHKSQLPPISYDDDDEADRVQEIAEAIRAVGDLDNRSGSDSD